MESAPRTDDPVPPYRPSMKQCFEHTDLQWRLGVTPDHWACRGAFFNMVDDRAGVFGHATQHAYREFFQIHRFSPLRFYPVKDYLTRMVVLSQIHFGAENIYRGLYDIQKGAFGTWKKMLIGRAAFALLGNDFRAVFAGLERGYASKTATNHSEMTVQSDSPKLIRASFRNEPLYIEHAIRGAIAGVAEVCGVPIEMSVELDDPFNGDIVVRVL